MNEHTRNIPVSPTTQAAEGLPRRRWTTVELERMVAAGILDDGERFELIGGEVVPMSPKGRRHEIVRDELSIMWTRSAPVEIRVSSEPQLNLADDVYTLPDLIVRPADILAPDVRGDTVLLVVEIADTSLTYDTVTKAALYASHGVREYWVVNARTLVTHVFTRPSSTGYGDVRAIDAGICLTPVLAPGLQIRLAELHLGDA